MLVVQKICLQLKMKKNLNQCIMLVIACLTGFVGDALLQIGVNQGLGGPTGWGLKPYFKQHGSGESLFIAGGMMTLFYIIFSYVAPYTYLNLAIFGIIIDFIFRKTMIFSSLQGYYEYFNYFWSAFWMAIPMMLPFFISKL